MKLLVRILNFYREWTKYLFVLGIFVMSIMAHRFRVSGQVHMSKLMWFQKSLLAIPSVSLKGETLIAIS